MSRKQKAEWFGIFLIMFAIMPQPYQWLFWIQFVGKGICLVGFMYNFWKLEEKLQ